MPRSLLALLCLLALASGAGAAADPPALVLSYHWEGGHSNYRFITVEITSEGRATCGFEYGRDRITAELDLTPEEVAYYEAQFRTVLALDEKAIQTIAVDTGETTWRITENGETKALTYQHTDDPWARDLAAEMNGLAEWQVALHHLRSGTGEGPYLSAYHVYELSHGRGLAPAELRAALREALARWPEPPESFYHQRDNLVYLLTALASRESEQQWAGDVMAQYARLPRASRPLFVQSLAYSNFLDEVGPRYARSLVPLLVQGLRELLAEPGLAQDRPRLQACSEVINALGRLRDERAIPVLASPPIWQDPADLQLPDAAANALIRMGLPGGKVLVERAASSDPRLSRRARWALEHAPQAWGYPDKPGSPPQGPWPGEADEVRQYLVKLGFATEGADIFSLPAEVPEVLRSSYPGFHLMLAEEFAPDVVDKARASFPDPGGPQRCTGDFDGNGLEDIALLVRKESVVRLVMLRQVAEKQWQASALEEFSYQAALENQPASFRASITTAPPMEVRPAALAREGAVLSMPQAGIEVHRPEGRTTVFYWPGG
jgi:hypothetical protein